MENASDKIEQLKVRHAELSANPTAVNLQEILQLIGEILAIVTPLLKPAPAPAS